MANPSIAGGEKFVPTAEPGERIEHGTEKLITGPATEPADLFNDNQWSPKGGLTPTQPGCATPLKK